MIDGRPIDEPIRDIARISLAHHSISISASRIAALDLFRSTPSCAGLIDCTVQM